jgi:hypothetical protein
VKGSKFILGPWAQNPIWQNYSSLVREAKTAENARTAMEKSHHTAASLYFGIAALEAFANYKLRKKLEETNVPEAEILKKLRRGYQSIVEKLTKCSFEVLGKDLTLSEKAASVISGYNAIRGEITHVKIHGRSIYQQLDKVEPLTLLDSVAEYFVRFHELEGSPYPYWIFGWNYLNPRPNSYEIILQHNDQFCYSLQALGFKVLVSPYCEPEFLSFQRYQFLKQGLSAIRNCEPKWIFPFKPILCQRWWTREHQVSCGHVTDEAIESARNYAKNR